eukprot:COSAG06_NODE_586_length_14002_cov_11.579228_10_plen_65_part_00
MAVALLTAGSLTCPLALRDVSARLSDRGRGPGAAAARAGRAEGVDGASSQRARAAGQGQSNISI